MQRTAGIALSLLLTFAVSAAELKGVVRGASLPLRDAHVYVYAAHPKSGIATICPNCYRDCGKKQQTDNAGRFQLKQLDNALNFDLLAVAEGYEPQLLRGVDAKETVEFKLTPRTNADANRLITGIVVDPMGKPVVGAMVEPAGYHIAQKLPDGRTTKRTGYGNIPDLDKLSITNARGEFALRIPDASGSLDVRVTAPSYAPQIDREFVPKEAKTITLTDGVAIRGTVMRDGKPLAGVPVMFIQRNRASSDFLGRFEIGTDDKGQFLMTNLGPNNEWVVYVPKDKLDGATVAPKLVKTGETKTKVDAGTLTVAKGRRVAGTILPGKGNRLPDTVQLMHDLTAESWSAKLKDGAFVFDAIPEGEIRLDAMRGGFILATTPELQDPKKWPPPFKLAGEGDLADVKVYAISER